MVVGYCGASLGTYTGTSTRLRSTGAFSKTTCRAQLIPRSSSIRCVSGRQIVLSSSAKFKWPGYCGAPLGTCAGTRSRLRSTGAFSKTTWRAQLIPRSSCRRRTLNVRPDVGWGFAPVVKIDRPISPTTNGRKNQSILSKKHILLRIQLFFLFFFY